MANRYTDKTEISREDYYKLHGLLALAKQHNDALRTIERAAAEITGDREEHGSFGLTSDEVYSERPDADSLLRRCGIEIAPAPEVEP